METPMIVPPSESSPASPAAPDPFVSVRDAAARGALFPDDLPLTIDQVACMIEETAAMVRAVVRDGQVPFEQGGKRGRISILARHVPLVKDRIEARSKRRNEVRESVASLAAKLEAIDKRLFALEESLELVRGA
jgi:hypothetical protein